MRAIRKRQDEDLEIRAAMKGLKIPKNPDLEADEPDDVDPEEKAKTDKLIEERIERIKARGGMRGARTNG